jgi:transposase
MGTPILVSANERDPWLRRLTLPAYQVKDAARYAGVTTQTVLNWQKEGNQVGSAIAHRKPNEASPQTDEACGEWNGSGRQA